MKLNITINKETNFICDRSLNSKKLSHLLKLLLLIMEEQMIDELVILITNLGMKEIIKNKTL